MKHRLGSGRILPPAGFEPATPWSDVGSANRSAMALCFGGMKNVDLFDALVWFLPIALEMENAV